MIDIHPIKLEGNWTCGYALDIHTIKSEFIGYDENDIEQFDTERSALGELIYQLKYKSDPAVMNQIVDSIIAFLSETWKIKNEIDYIVPVPPSKKNRPYQPVIEISKILSSKSGIPLASGCLIKVKDTPQLKEIHDIEQRKKILQNAFDIDRNNLSLLKGKNLLLIDDLFRSGATLECVTDILYKKGDIKSVFVMAVTKTRKKT